ncbi:MAG: hypothetical protein ACR2OX_11760 [Methyloligellaceae bacterium]
MISMEDCLALCDLTEEEILAIAEHEHMPEMAAIAYAQYLANHDHGPEKIFRIIVDDIRASQSRNDRQHVQDLLHVLHHFIRSHPEAAPKQHPWHTVF